LPPTGDSVHEIEGFRIFRQETDHTCGPCAVRMVLLHLGRNVSERRIAALSMTHPLETLPWTLLMGYRKLLKPLGFDVVMSENDRDVYERMIVEIKENRPVIFVYGTIDDFHPPKKVTHYGIAVGIDEPAGTITIANPFGKLEKMRIEEWWERFSLLPEYAPLAERLAVRLGVLQPRTAFFLVPEQGIHRK